MNSPRINRKTIFFILIIIAIAIAGFFVSKFLFGERGEAKEFIGQVKKVEGNVILVNGVFVNQDKPELARNGFRKEGVKIVVSPETTIVKILMYMPTSEELKKTDGRWNPADLKQEETSGTLADLTDRKEGSTIRAVSDKNIFNKSKFTAKRIEFVEQIYPGRP